jgi:hypothetical protein
VRPTRAAWGAPTGRACCCRRVPAHATEAPTSTHDGLCAGGVKRWSRHWCMAAGVTYHRKPAGTWSSRAARCLAAPPQARHPPPSHCPISKASWKPSNRSRPTSTRRSPETRSPVDRMLRPHAQPVRAARPAATNARTSPAIGRARAAAVRARAAPLGDQAAAESQQSRRAVLLAGFGAPLLAAAAHAGGGLALPRAAAAAEDVDWAAVRGAIADVMKADPLRGPTLLRLAWHSSGSYDKVRRSGHRPRAADYSHEHTHSPSQPQTRTSAGVQHRRQRGWHHTIHREAAGGVERWAPRAFCRGPARACLAAPEGPRPRPARAPSGHRHSAAQHAAHLPRGMPPSRRRRRLSPPFPAAGGAGARRQRGARPGRPVAGARQGQLPGGFVRRHHHPGGGGGHRGDEGWGGCRGWGCRGRGSTR